MRAVLVTAAVAGALIALTPAPGGMRTGTSLRVTYWADSAQASETVTRTLRCNPARGSLAHPGVACRKLAAGGAKLFAPLQKNVACTEIYGGPQKARVVGTLAGRPIRATFSRTDGCQIARWSRVSPWLLPPGGVT